jgi:hypothetical protein
MIWFLLNGLLAAAFFGAWVGIPLWMIVKHPDIGPSLSAADACLDAKSLLAEDRQPEPALAA